MRDEDRQRDITGRKLADEALRKSEARYKSIFECAAVGITLLDLDGRFWDCNPAMQKMLGYSCKELCGKSVYDITHPDDLENTLAFVNKLATGQRLHYHLEKRYARKDGKLLWGRTTASIVKDSGGKPEFIIGIIENITERKMAGEKILAYQDQLRSMAAELSLAEERERRRIATDIHDYISQPLAAAKIKSGLLRESLSDDLLDKVDEIRILIEEAIEYSRSLTSDLSSPILYELGFEPAMEWLCERFQERHGIQVSFSHAKQPGKLDAEISVTLFKAVRELLTNAVKHSKAQRVEVSIENRGDNICVYVEDNGIGINISNTGFYSGKYGGFGLFSISERLKYLGGRMKTTLQGGHGTRVTLEAPLKRKQKVGETGPG